jgi:hypothetical protein
MRGRRPLRAIRLVRLGNPVVRAVLRSRAHPTLSGRLLVLSYRGHRSERSFEIPLRYAETADGRLVVAAVAPAGKLWWRSFAGGRPASVTLRRRTRPVVGALAEGETRDEALAAYAARYPRSASLVRDAAIVVLVPSR